MEILRTYSGLTNGLSITLNTEQDFKLDLGWQDNMDQFEEEVIDQILNLPENYETIRYIHKSYTSINNINQHDIWYYFIFKFRFNIYQWFRLYFNRVNNKRKRKTT